MNHICAVFGSKTSKCQIGDMWREFRPILEISTIVSFYRTTGIGPCVFHIIYRASQKNWYNFFEVWQLLCPKVPRVPKSAQKCPECPKMTKSVKSVQKCPKWPESDQSCQTSKSSILSFFWDTLYATAPNIGWGLLKLEIDHYLQKGTGNIILLIYVKRHLAVFSLTWGESV